MKETAGGPVKIKILDQEYLLLSDEAGEKVEKIARFVDQKLREIKEHSKGLPDKKTAILAAFHIASDYFQLIETHEGLLKAIRDKSSSLIQKINTELQ